MRAFVAADVACTPELAALLAEPGLGSPARPDGLHFTLQFLGEVTEGAARGAAAALAGVAFDPFDVELRGAGAFPESGSPRVVWVGAADGGRLAGLARRVEAALAPLGFSRDRPFAPHLTVFRVKRKAGGIRERLAGMGSACFGTRRVDRIRLKASPRDPGGPYEDLWESPA